MSHHLSSEQNEHHSLAPKLSAFFARSSKPPMRKNAYGQYLIDVLRDRVF